MTTIQIEKVVLEPTQVIKKLQGQPLDLVVKLRLDDKFRKNSIVVEAVKEKEGKYKIYKLSLHRILNSIHIFKTRITCNETGIFFIKVRYKKKDEEYWNWLSAENIQLDVQPDYLNDLIVYNAFIRFFSTKSINGGVIKPGEGGTFDDLKKKLPELKKLGINCLYLNPVHIIGELYRNYNPHDLVPSYLQPGSPYSIKDYKSIDPELSFDKDHEKDTFSDPSLEFKELIDAAHKKGIRVIMDMVFNHTAHDYILQRLHPEWYLYKSDITSLDEPYIYPEEIKEGKHWGDARYTFSPFDHGYWWKDAAQLNWEYKIPEGSNKPPKNPTLKEMWTYFKSITKYWVINFGIDGFRCDVAYRIPPEFWYECIKETREVAKKHKTNLDHDVIFIAESYCDDLYELQKAGFTAVYSDYSNKLGNIPDIKGYLDYIYNNFPKNSTWFLFPECHDFHRTPQRHASHSSSKDNSDCNANKSRWTITATLPGIPMIFNGFEKIEWHPVNLFSYSSIDWERDKDLTEHISKINKIRSKSDALKHGKYIYVDTNQGIQSTAQIFAFARISPSEKVLVITNIDVNSKAVATTIYLPEELSINFTKKYKLQDLLHDKTYIREGKELIVFLDPGDSHIFRVIQ